MVEEIDRDQFMCVYLLARLSEDVKSHVAKRSVNLWFEARLLCDSAGKSSKQGKLKKVYCYITPRVNND